MEPENLKQLEMFTGPAVQPLLRNKEATEERLNDVDPKMRWAALVLMTHHWGPTEQFKIKCEHMALRDADPQVRSTALGCLGSCFTETSDRGIEKLLAGVVADVSEKYSIRRAAYVALFYVNGRQPMPRPELILNMRIPEDVDWDFVCAMLK